MTVPHSPCMLDLDAPSPQHYSMYSPATPGDGYGTPVAQWSVYQVKQWLREILADHSFADVRLACDRLGTVTGKALLTLAEPDLQAHVEDPILASTIFSELRRRLKAEAARTSQPRIASPLYSAYSVYPSPPPSSLCSPPLSPVSSVGSPMYLPEPLRDPYDDTYLPLDEVLPTGWSTPATVYHEMKPPTRRSPDHIQEVPSPSWYSPLSPATPAAAAPAAPAAPAARADGGLSAGSLSGDDSQQAVQNVEAQQKRPPNRGGRKKSLHGKLQSIRKRDREGLGQRAPKGRLWQFLVRLLLSPERNPSIIRWDDEEEGVFCFVDGQAVARLWGEQKHNKEMTYEKMSRTMRTYKNEAFAAHPRRLFYKFGVKAKWRELARSIKSARG